MKVFLFQTKCFLGSKIKFQSFSSGTDIVFCKLFDVNMDNAFKDFSWNKSINRNKKRMEEFFRKLIAFKTEVFFIKKLKGMKSVEKKIKIIMWLIVKWMKF